MEEKDDGLVHGFYYDQQMVNPLTTITLHPNQELNSDETEWQDVYDPDDEDYATYTDSSGNERTPPKYSRTPICTAIIQEDFQVSIANTFSDFGGDPIGELWNSNKPMAPYLAEMAKGLGVIAEKTTNYIKSSGLKEDSYLTKGLGILANFLGNVSERTGNMSDYLSRSLVVQGTRFSYYSGTGIDFGNLQMKFTIFSQYVYDEENDDYIFLSVKDQVSKILPYVIGEFKAVTEAGGGEVGKFISEFASWQMPPGNFAANMKNVDVVQKGTLKLKIGPYFAVENIVIGGCTLKFSKAMAKDPTDSEEAVFPMACEVELILKPVTKYSRKSLERFIYGDASTNSRVEFVNKMKEDIDSKQGKIDADLDTLGEGDYLYNAKNLM